MICNYLKSKKKIDEIDAVTIFPKERNHLRVSQQRRQILTQSQRLHNVFCTFWVNAAKRRYLGAVVDVLGLLRY